MLGGEPSTFRDWEHLVLCVSSDHPGRAGGLRLGDRVLASQATSHRRVGARILALAHGSSEVVVLNAGRLVDAATPSKLQDREAQRQSSSRHGQSQSAASAFSLVPPSGRSFFVARGVLRQDTDVVATWLRARDGSGSAISPYDSGEAPGVPACAGPHRVWRRRGLPGAHGGGRDGIHRCRGGFGCTHRWRLRGERRLEYWLCYCRWGWRFTDGRWSRSGGLWRHDSDGRYRERGQYG